LLVRDDKPTINGIAVPGTPLHRLGTGTPIRGPMFTLSSDSISMIPRFN